MLYFGVNILYDENYGSTSLSYNFNYGEYDANSGNIDWDFYE